MSQRYIFDSAEIGNFDDARRSNADADAHETRKNERDVYITSNDASIVARGVRSAPRGVAQIDRYVLRHVIGEPTVVWNGLEIERRGTTIHVTQVSKVREMSREFAPLLVQFGLAGNAKTPQPEFTAEDLFNPAHAITVENATKEDLNTLHLYQRVVGAMTYIAVYTRFDISYAIGRAARLMHCASKEHLRGAARLLRYIIDN